MGRKSVRVHVCKVCKKRLECRAEVCEVREDWCGRLDCAPVAVEGNLDASSVTLWPIP